MSVLQKAFHLVDLSQLDSANPKLIRLTRHVTNELTLLSVLAPLMVSDVAVQICEEVFATDASLQKGAIVSCSPGKTIVEVLWKSCRSKGGYSKLLTREQAILPRCMDFEEFDVPKTEPVQRPLAFRFAFIEVFAGSQHAWLGEAIQCVIQLISPLTKSLMSLRCMFWSGFCI